MVEIICCDVDDGASLIVEAYDDDGDVLSGRFFRCEAFELEPATQEQWDLRYMHVPDACAFPKRKDIRAIEAGGGDTPLTMSLLQEILDAGVDLDERSAPSRWVKLAKSLERKLERITAQRAKALTFLEKELLPVVRLEDQKPKKLGGTNWLQVIGWVEQVLADGRTNKAPLSALKTEN